MSKKMKSRSGTDPKQWEREAQAKADTQLVAVIAGNIYARQQGVTEEVKPLRIQEAVFAASLIVEEARRVVREKP